MNLKTKVKGKLIAYGCSNTKFPAIVNGFVKVLLATRKSPFVRFGDVLWKKSSLIVSYTTNIDIPNDTLISQLNETPLLEVVSNPLISTAQVRNFGVAVHDVAKHHGGKQYIHADKWFITMKFENPLCMCLLGNPPSGILTTLTVLCSPHTIFGIQPP